MTKTKDAPETPPAVEADPFENLVPGRMVHYYPHERETRFMGEAYRGKPWAAVVTMVGHHSWPETPGLVSLNVHVPMTPPVGHDPVDRREQVPFSETPAEGCWSWMFPGQAGRYTPR